MIERVLASLPRYRKATASALPLVIEIIGDFVGVSSPWYVKAVSAAGIVAVFVAPKNAA